VPVHLIRKTPGARPAAAYTNCKTLTTAQFRVIPLVLRTTTRGRHVGRAPHDRPRASEGEPSCNRHRHGLAMAGS
jgi:hypothetical protein